MLQKLFGENADQQWVYLRYRVPITLAIVVVACLPWSVQLSGAIALAAYYWGWCGIKRWLGLASILSLFGGYCNIMLGVLIVLGFALLGYLVGLGVFLLGFFLWVVLVVKRRGQHAE